MDLLAVVYNRQHDGGAAHIRSPLKNFLMSSVVNYASFEGIYKNELPGAMIFAALYAPLFVFNVFRSVRHPTYVLIVLAFFCMSKSLYL